MLHDVVKQQPTAEATVLYRHCAAEYEQTYANTTQGQSKLPGNGVAI